MPATHLTRSRFFAVLAVLGVVLLAVMTLAASVGSVHIDLLHALLAAGPQDVDRVIL